MGLCIRPSMDYVVCLVRFAAVANTYLTPDLTSGGCACSGHGRYKWLKSAVAFAIMPVWLVVASVVW
jgi:hypothetical protein